MKHSRPSRSSRRVGVAYLLAMLYLMLFTVLGIALAAASSLSVQMANNDRCAADAQAAAESGLEFVRYQLGQIVIPPDTSDADLLSAIADGLGRQLDGSPNMNGKTVIATGNTIDLPAANDSITLNPVLGTAFHAQITVKGPAVLVKIVGHGHNESISRAIQLEFRQTPHIVNGASDGTRLVPMAGTYEEVSP